MSTFDELSNEQGFMDIESESNLLTYINNNHNISSVNTSNNDHLMELYVAKDLLDTVNYIVLYNRNNINNSHDQLTDSAKQRFINISQRNGDPKIIIDLIIAFVESYSIYINFIAFEQGKFRIINEYSFSNEDKQKKQTFIVLNGDYTVCGPLFAQDLIGRMQTVFAVDDMRINHYVEKYIERLNLTDPRSFPQAKSEGSISNVLQDYSNDMPVDHISTLVNESDSRMLVQSKNTIELSPFGDQIIQKIVPPCNTLSAHHTNPTVVKDVQYNHLPVISSNEDPEHNGHQDNINQRNESNRVMQADQISTASTYLSSTTIVPQTLSAETSQEAPEIIKQPKPEWDVRYASDLIPKSEKEKKMRYIGLLQGVGGQRSRIQVKVPLDETRQMYLASTVRTLNNQHHSLKINVPAKTKVNERRLSDANDLDCLEFDECDSMHYFDPDTWTVYMEITPAEHRAKRKEVPIHMFNLYQNRELTKNMIRREQLNKCILAFWLCYKEHGLYTPISPESLSSIITEKKKKKHPP